MIHWAQPLWLWALFLIPLSGVFCFWQMRRRTEAFEKFFLARAQWGALLRWNPRTRPLRIMAWHLGFFFLILALARPQWGEREEVVHTQGLDVLFVLDVSKSMGVEDVFPNRLEKAKHWIRSFAEKLGGDRFGLVLVAGEALLLSPLTIDRDFFLRLLESVSCDAIPMPGTHFAAGLKVAWEAFERGGQEESQAQVLLFLSDGEDHEGEIAPWTQRLKQKGIHFYALGVGTEKGGPVPVKDESGTLVGFKKEASGKPVISPLQETALQSMASQAGGRYQRVTPEEKEADSILSEVGRLDRTDFQERRTRIPIDRFQIPLGLACLAFLGELLVPLAVLAGIFLLVPQVALATPAFSDWELYEKNQKGLEAFSKQDWEGAQKAFEEAYALNPKQSTVQWNRALGALAAGKSEEAIDFFERLLKNADESQKALLRYHLGLAYQGQGRLPEAVQNYRKTIEEAQKEQNSALEKAARKNLELLFKRPPPPPKQCKNTSSQKNSQADKSQKNKNASSEKNASSQESQKEPPQKTEPEESRTSPAQEKKSPAAPFRSEHLNQQDAERVFSELQEKEKKLQKKWELKKGKGSRSQPKPLPPFEKDW